MKPGTYTQMYVQIVFAVERRKVLLKENMRNQVFDYIGGIVRNLKHKSLIVNGVSNHVHILLGLNPSVSISDTVHDIKRGSSIFINKGNFLIDRFSWQEGYGAFTYSRKELDNIYQYVRNQEIHHNEVSFKDEYIEMLKNNDIDFDSRYLFNFLED